MLDLLLNLNEKSSLSQLLRALNVNFFRTFYTFFDLLPGRNNNHHYCSQNNLFSPSVVVSELSPHAEIKYCVKELLKWTLRGTDDQLTGFSWDHTVMLYESRIKWCSISFTIFNWGCIILSKTKWISGLVVKQQMRPIITSYWTNLDGGFTNKCNKNFPFIIITSMLAGLTDPTTGSSFYNSFALGVYFHTSIKTYKKRRYLSQWKFEIPILCLGDRNNVEPNKSLIKLIAVISLSFPWMLNIVLPAGNVWTLLHFIGFSNHTSKTHA